MATNLYSVKGRIVDQSDTGVAVYIEVWDWDQTGVSADLLIAGKASEPDGSFGIDISNDVDRLHVPPGLSEAPRRTIDTNPDIFLKIYDLTPSGGRSQFLMHTRDSVTMNVPPGALDLGKIELATAPTASS